MSELSDKKCIPCAGGVPPLELNKKNELKGLLHTDWNFVEDNKKLHRSFKFKNFAKALDFVNKIGNIAEEQMHHPDLKLGWGYVEVEILTHKITDLVESDFILAAKIDESI
jgi:4a-hydroxytetrahydrobiopterin dehydratase